jgi:hypothetical protein
MGRDPYSASVYDREYRQRNKERIAARKTASREQNRKCNAAYRERNRERLRAKAKDYYHQNKERINARDTASRQCLRAQVIVAYGAECACCGETEPAFLTLDHVDGGGKKDQRESGGYWGMLRRLRRDGWPEGYQILCANCNMAKAFSPGGCPHQQNTGRRGARGIDSP